jgi:hypothetical protein
MKYACLVGALALSLFVLPVSVSAQQMRVPDGDASGFFQKYAEAFGAKYLVKKGMVDQGTMAYVFSSETDTRKRGMAAQSVEIVSIKAKDSEQMLKLIETESQKISERQNLIDMDDLSVPLPNKEAMLEAPVFYAHYQPSQNINGFIALFRSSLESLVRVTFVDANERRTEQDIALIKKMATDLALVQQQ